MHTKSRNINALRSYLMAWGMAIGLIITWAMIVLPLES